MYHNELTIRVIALQRSGHHAIIQWMMNNFSPRAVFVNNPWFGENIFLSCGCQEANAQDSSLMLNNRIVDLDLQAEKRGQFSHKEVLVYNYEDVALSSVFALTEQEIERISGRSRRFYTLIVLRDPFNMTASRIKKNSKNKYYFAVYPYVARGLSLWKEYARYAVARGKFFDNVLVVNYDHFIESFEERSKIADCLGLTLRDDSMEAVPVFGGGSSFEKGVMEFSSISGKVRQRWRIFLKDWIYLGLFDNELIGLSRKIFGETEAYLFIKKERASKAWFLKNISGRLWLLGKIVFSFPVYFWDKCFILINDPSGRRRILKKISFPKSAERCHL